MGYDVRTKGHHRKDAPDFHLSYSTAYWLSSRCRVLNESLFFEPTEHVVGHEDLLKARRSLGRFLGGYVPEELLSVSGDIPDDYELKFSAYQLRGVIQYALDKRRDIIVSG